MSRSARPVRALVAVAAAGALTFVSVEGGAQEGSPAVRPFAATAEAAGVSVHVFLPGAPGTNDIVDLGTPGVSVRADSIGSSTATAALPDPGELIVAAPGLVAGVLNLGAAGLPPIEVPTLPEYPLIAAADVGSQPDVVVGAGPYALEAHSHRGGGSARATGGVRTDVGGNAALAAATGEIGLLGDGTLVVTATGGIEGLTIGPLNIGEVRSTARLTRGPDGLVVPTSDITIAALSVGGLSVELGPEGLSLAGAAVPLPIADVAARLLGATGVTLEVKPGIANEREVVAPALAISMPVDAGPLAAGPGTMTITVGFASVSLVGTTSGGAGPAPTGGTPSPSPGGGGLAPSSPAPSPSRPTSSGATGVPPSNLGAGLGTSPTVALGPAVPTQSTGPIEEWSVRALYLAMAVGGLCAYALVHAIRLLGVRTRWTSPAG